MYKKAIPLLKQLSVKLLLATLLFTSIAPPISHAIITNGSDAINLLGQYDDNLTDPGPIYTKGPANNAPHRLGFDFDHDSTRGMVIDETNHRLFVSDTNNNRVLVYDLNPDNSISDRIPDYVLGQPNFYTNTAATTQAGMNIPTGVTYDATNNLLFVAQAGAHRVTVYDVAEITNGENAINVLGQANFTSSGAATTQAGMHTPQDVAYDPTNDRLFVSQVGNHRVTVYDVSTITNGENAINVIGQSAYGNLSALTTQTGMNAPRGLAFDDTNQRLFVAQTGNHRVTVYDVTAITNGEAATHVLGQADFTSSVLATTASSMRRPYGLAYDDTNERLFISSYDSARVTVFDVTTIDNNENATHVLGVANFTTNGTGTTIATTYGPRGLAYNSSNQHLFVAQGLNHRISIFDVTAIGNGENAVDLLGQYDDNLEDPSPNYLVSLPNNTANSLGLNLNHASNKGVALDSVNHRLFVADTENHRVLVYNLNPDNTLIDRIPDKVLGQINFKNNASAVSQSRMTSPTGLAYDPINNRLFVANANRVTVYDVATITNGEAATHVLGQLDFNSGGSATTQARLNSPQGLALGNSRLYVTDTGNNRVLLFNISPASISNGQNALSVLGQPNFTTSGADNTNVKMNNPRDVAYDVANQRLFVAQAGNHRVSVFDVVSTTTGEAAVNILGQPSFASTSASNTASGMSQPYGVTYDSDSDRLFVAQSGNHRVTVYDTTEITDGEAAINILGQTSFLTATSGTTISKLNQPRGVAYDPINKSLFVAESGNNRIMLFDAGAPVIDFSLTETGGSTAVTENTTTDTFDIVLTAQPATDVVFTITSDTPTAASVSHDTITFTNGNWSTPQTITVSAPEDDNVVSENAVITISIDTDLSDNDWLAVADQTVTVAVTDTTVAPPPSGGGLIPILILDSTPPTTENESDGTDSEPEYELSETTFSDIISHWGGLHIIMIEKKCGAEGYYYQDENGLYVRDFKPDHDMSRAEFVKIILECKDFKFDPNDKVETPYSDVAETDWFAPYLAEAHKIGIIDGYADGAFRPNAPITREEALKTVLLIQFEEADITADTTNQASPFLDVPTTEWFSQYVIYAYIKNFITGYTTYDGTPTNIFGVGNNITRAEGAKMITKTLNL